MSGGLEDLNLEPVVKAVREFVDAFERGDRRAHTSPDPDQADLFERLALAPKELPGDVAELLVTIGAALEPGFDTAGPGFLSYIPTGALPVAALGSYLGAVTNRYTGANHAAPGAVALEHSVIGWMRDLFGLPSTGGGVLFSGGSIANLTATVAARSRYGEDFASGTIYSSERSHHSVAKAARIAGIATDRVRAIGTDTRYQLDIEALTAAIKADRSAGLRPMAIVATAGTTDTGAIDPLVACAQIAADNDSWFHVDAAYGGFFQLTDRGRERLSGIELADSITVDAHKSLFLPFGIGGLIVRDEAALVDAHEGRGAYMQDLLDDSLPHYFTMGPELSRPNRGLQLWLALHVHGVDAFRVDLDRMLDLAEYAAAALAQLPGVTVNTRGSLSIVTFSADAGDAATRTLMDSLNNSGEVHVSSTTLDRRLVIRAAFLSYRSNQSVVERLVELVRERTQ